MPVLARAEIAKLRDGKDVFSFQTVEHEPESWRDCRPQLRGLIALGRLVSSEGIIAVAIESLRSLFVQPLFFGQ